MVWQGKGGGSATDRFEIRHDVDALRISLLEAGREVCAARFGKVVGVLQLGAKVRRVRELLRKRRLQID